MINGNTTGVRQYILEEMEALYEMHCDRNTFISATLIEALAKYTELLGREISVFLSRSGKVMDVSIGEKDNVTLPFMRRRRGSLGLSGIRCIHTHPNGTSQLSDVDIGTLLSSRLDAMAAISVREGEAKSIHVAMIGQTLSSPVGFGPFYIHRIPNAFLMEEIERATVRVVEEIRLSDTREAKERAILLGLTATEEEMNELALLAETAGAEVVGEVTQMRTRDAAYYVGKGKLKELQLMISAAEADIVICNDELSAIEVRNLEDMLGVSIVDRTVLILDIFAKNAKTREGKLQVELAQLQYNLPRLLGTGTMLSRLGGGIGTRGPGETKLEVDRRRIRRRIFELEQEIKKLTGQRALRREQREKNRMTEIALVGYTNAGKTSLLNALADETQHAENKLFATLDPVTRRVKLPSGKEVLVTDTVGFISKLPHALVSAFRSTLEVATQADVLLNVADAANLEREMQNEVVSEVLRDLGAGDKKLLSVYNKADLLEPGAPRKEGVYYVSAKTGEGIEALLQAIETAIRPELLKVKVSLSYQEGAKLAKIQQYAEKIAIEYEPDFMRIEAELPKEQAIQILK
ncbi:MAG: GTPase HflX [Christensenellaceae bacterium]